MGRGKIEIKKIENNNNRQVTFTKRRNGLFKKARELAILCEADIGVIIFSSTGKVFHYASSCMDRIMSRYREFISEGTPPENKPEQPIEEVDDLREEIQRLKLSQLRLLGKDLTGMGVQELHDIEQKLNDGLLSIKARKEELLMQQLQESRLQEKRAMLENQTLRRQVDMLQSFLPMNHDGANLMIEDVAMEETMNMVRRGSRTSDMAEWNGGIGDYDSSDTTLYLGPPTARK